MDEFIVMGRAASNDEFRPSNRTHRSQSEAHNELVELREVYQEARSMWVELLKDKDFFMRQREYDHEEPDPDWMYD